MEIKNIFGMFGKKKEEQGSKIKITNVNIMWRGKFHSLAGVESTDTTISLSVPFSNNTDVSPLVKDLFKSAGSTVIIKDIKVDGPFEIVDLKPKPPVSIQENQKVVFEFKIKAQMESYSGPLLLRFLEEEKEKVKIEINKVSLSAKGKNVDVENSALIFESEKNQIFKNSIQMYKVLSFNDEVHKVSLNKPFEFVSSDPKLPFKVDNENSYIVTFYIKTPEMSYAGPLEFEFK